jgi:hypothetical protein
MPRVPTTAEQGRQNIGGIGITTNVSTPFQQFSVPVLDGGATTKLGEAITSSAGDLAKTIEASQAKNEKRALLLFQTQVDEVSNKLLLDPQVGLGSKSGEDALSLIRGQSGWPTGADPQESLVDTFASKIEGIQSSLGEGLSTSAQTALKLAGQGVTNRFTATVNKAEIDAQAKVDLALVTNRISSSAEKAAAAVGQDSRVLASEIASALNSVEAAVRDPDIGLASQNGITNPELIDELVRKQHGLVYKRVIEQMISLGDTAGAMTLLDDQTKEGGSLRGTAEAIALNSSILLTRQSVHGKQIFNIVKTLYPDDISSQLGYILAIPNVNQRALALAEWKANNTIINVVKRDQISKETFNLIKFINDNPGKSPDARSFPALAQFVPLLLFGASSKVRGATTAKMLDKATAAHVAAGGSAVGNITVAESMARMAKTNPSAFNKLMENPKNIKLFTTPSQWVQLQAAGIVSQQAQLDATSGAVKYDSVLKALGFKDTSSKYKDLIQNPNLHIALNDARQRIFDQTGKKATSDDLTPIIAKFALPVDKSWDINPTLYHLSEYSKAGTVDSKTMLDTPLDLDKDRDLVPLHYALDRKVTARQIRKIVDEIAGPVTLRMIAEKVKGGVEALKLGQWEQDRVDFHNAVLGMGYPPEFMSAMLDIQGLDREGLPHTEGNAKMMAEQFKMQPEAYKRQFEKWAAGGPL